MTKYEATLTLDEKALSCLLVSLDRQIEWLRDRVADRQAKWSRRPDSPLAKVNLENCQLKLEYTEQIYRKIAAAHLHASYPESWGSPTA